MAVLPWCWYTVFLYANSHLVCAREPWMNQNIYFSMRHRQRLFHPPLLSWAGLTSNRQTRYLGGFLLATRPAVKRSESRNATVGPKMVQPQQRKKVKSENTLGTVSFFFFFSLFFYRVVRGSTGEGGRCKPFISRNPKMKAKHDTRKGLCVWLCVKRLYGRAEL